MYDVAVLEAHAVPSYLLIYHVTGKHGVDIIAPEAQCPTPSVEGVREIVEGSGDRRGLGISRTFVANGRRGRGAFLDLTECTLSFLEGVMWVISAAQVHADETAVNQDDSTT
jgi:hypothetical protein